MLLCLVLINKKSPAFPYKTGRRLDSGICFGGTGAHLRFQGAYLLGKLTVFRIYRILHTPDSQGGKGLFEREVL